MRIGKAQRQEWDKYKVLNFKMPMPVPNHGPVWECGAFALHVLTKKDFEPIMKMSRKGHWPTKLMINFLKDNGFTVIQVNIGNTVSAHSVKTLGKPRLGRHHVLLIDQMVYKEESTWSVIHNGLLAHSGDVDSLDITEFINNPIEDAYLVYHPDWK